MTELFCTGNYSMAIAPAALIPIISGLISLGTSVFGGVKNAKARKAQQDELRKQEQRALAFYNRDYYGDYTKRADVQAGLQTMRDELQKQADTERNISAITGATPEARSKALEHRTNAIGRYMRDMATRGMAFKDRATDRYLGAQAGIDHLNYQALENRALSGSNMMYNGLNGLASAAGTWAGVLGNTTNAAQNTRRMVGAHPIKAAYKVPTVGDIKVGTMKF